MANILVVLQEEENGRQVKLDLAKAGNSVSDADCEAGLPEAIRQIEPDLVVIDVSDWDESDPPELADIMKACAGVGAKVFGFMIGYLADDSPAKGLISAWGKATLPDGVTPIVNANLIIWKETTVAELVREIVKWLGE